MRQLSHFRFPFLTDMKRLAPKNLPTLRPSTKRGKLNSFIRRFLAKRCDRESERRVSEATYERQTFTNSVRWCLHDDFPNENAQLKSEMKRCVNAFVLRDFLCCDAVLYLDWLIEFHWNSIVFFCRIFCF